MCESSTAAGKLQGIQTMRSRYTCEERCKMHLIAETESCMLKSRPSKTLAHLISFQSKQCTMDKKWVMHPNACYIGASQGKKQRCLTAQLIDC